MDRYAQLSENIIQIVIESETDPDGINGEWILCPPNVGPGWTYDGTDFLPPQLPVPEVKPYEWFIDIGPFFDRFGATKMAILTSTDAGVKAILADIQVRKWIDLKRADVASALDYIMTKVPSVTDATKSYVLDTPVTAEENLALRKLYF